jgi:hypothetical protein
MKPSKQPETPRSFEERRAHAEGLKQQAEAAWEADVARLAKERAEVDRKKAATLRAASEASEAETCRCDEAIATDLAKALRCLEKFATSPRETAAAVATAWRSCEDRCRAEVNSDLDGRHLALGMGRVLGVEAQMGADIWSRLTSNRLASACDRAVREIRLGSSSIVVEEALRALEVEVAKLHTSSNVDAERAQAMTRFATSSRSAGAVQELERERSAARQADFERRNRTLASAIDSRVV